ncbi:MAG: hypothetical protein K0R13_2334 [Propionibacteriaceae bacterium]|nr:hypothetical protein [Propionibacteriaceae bacterium]
MPLRWSYLAGPGWQQRQGRGRRARRCPVQEWRSPDCCWRRRRMTAMVSSLRSSTSSGSTPKATSPPIRDAMRPTPVRRWASPTRRPTPSTIRPRPDPKTGGRGCNAQGRCSLYHAPVSERNGVESEVKLAGKLSVPAARASIVSPEPGGLLSNALCTQHNPICRCRGWLLAILAAFCGGGGLGRHLGVHVRHQGCSPTRQPAPAPQRPLGRAAALARLPRRFRWPFWEKPPAEQLL